MIAASNRHPLNGNDLALKENNEHVAEGQRKKNDESNSHRGIIVLFNDAIKHLLIEI